jgi:hypothetical protein
MKFAALAFGAATVVAGILGALPAIAGENHRHHRSDYYRDCDGDDCGDHHYRYYRYRSDYAVPRYDRRYSPDPWDYYDPYDFDDGNYYFYRRHHRHHSYRHHHHRHHRYHDRY